MKSIIKMNLRKLVNAKGITQTEFAEILEVAEQSTVSNYMNDGVDSVPDVASLYNVTEHYGIPFDTFYFPNFDPSNSYEIEARFCFLFAPTDRMLCFISRLTNKQLDRTSFG